MRVSLLTAALLVGIPLGLGSAQTSVLNNPVKNPPVKGPQVKPVGGQATPAPLVLALNGSDNCASAAANDAITGPGTYAINNVGATTSSPIGSCASIGSDVWFYWTATATGVATVTTCGSVSGDSAIAVWNDGAPAGSCPTTEIACNDDACANFATTVQFPCTAGAKYFLEVGGYSGAQYSGSFTISIATPPANDNCASPTVIAGPGPHAFDNGAASTGAQGQAEAACNFFGFTAINNDVWYTWTSGFTGNARISTCGSTIDTKIAIYNGAGCPAGATIACQDDACNLQTRLDFPVTAGGVYTIQLGLYGGTTAGGAGTFTITQFIPPMNDGCATPQALVGNGPHPYDTTSYTTGVEGQAEPLCNNAGSAQLFNDGWWTWTAPTTGQYDVNLCSGTNFDSKIAIYAGAGCPTGPAIVCNDDFCGLASALCLSATAGQTYTIQIGSYGAAQSGTGDLVFIPTGGPAPAACDPVEDGSSENLLRHIGGGTLVWLSAFGTIGQPTSLGAIQACVGSPAFPGFYVPSGPITVAVYEDPTDDNDPSDAVLLPGSLTTVAILPGSVDTDVFQTIALAGGSVVVNGRFFIAGSVQHGANEYPAPFDMSVAGGACGGGSNGSSWFVGNSAPTADFANLNNNTQPPLSLASLGFPGNNFLIRPVCGPTSTGTGYCFGDGTGTACPCGNVGAAGNGCANSQNAAGAHLAATGNATVGADTVVLQGTGMTGNSSCLYFQGTSQISVAFGDGLRCAGGTVIRLGTKNNVGGVSQYPVPGDPLISVRGMVPAGATRNYQVWYRNAAAFCTPSTFNLSNGLSITWN